MVHHRCTERTGYEGSFQVHETPAAPGRIDPRTVARSPEVGQPPTGSEGSEWRDRPGPTDRRPRSTPSPPEPPMRAARTSRRHATAVVTTTLALLALLVLPATAASADSTCSDELLRVSPSAISGNEAAV